MYNNRNRRGSETLNKSDG